MSLTLKQTIVDIGYGIETLGHITIVVASIVGVVLTTIALIAHAQKINNSQHGTTNNFFWINIPNNSTCHRSHRCTYSEHSNRDFYVKLIAASFCFSLIGVGIAIAVPMYWIGITIVALWASGLLLSALGRGLINIGLNWEDKIEPIINTSDAQEQTRVIPEAVSLDTPSFPKAISTQEAIPVNGIDTHSDTEGRWVSYHTPFVAQCVGY